MSSQSCTRTLQCSKCRHYGITVVDTPGFYATEDVAHHTLCQIQALTQTGALSGIYVVVKYARCSDMAETVNKIMDFVGDDGEEYIRVIVTNIDTVEKQDFNGDETKADLAHLLDIPPHHIAFTGNAHHDDHTAESKSSNSSIEEFIHTTLHPRPRTFRVSNDQLGCISNLCVGARKFNQVIEDVNSKLKAAGVACQTLVVSSASREDEGNFDLPSCRSLCRHKVFAIHATRKATKFIVHETRDQLNLQGGQELIPEERKVLSDKLDRLLSVSLKSFLNQTDLKGASFYPQTHDGYPSLYIDFRKQATIVNDWEVVYHLNGQEIPVSNVVMRLKEFCFEQKTIREKRTKYQDRDQMEAKHKTKRVPRPDDLPCFGDSSGRNAPNDDRRLDNISCSTPSRQNKSSSANQAGGAVNSQDLLDPTPQSCCNCLFFPFRFLRIRRNIDRVIVVDSQLLQPMIIRESRQF